MLFAKSLDRFGRLARKAVRVVVYAEAGKLHTERGWQDTKGYATGFRGLMEYINSVVPSNEVIEQALQREVKMFPELAIRELVANAIIRQDFCVTGMSV